MDMTEPPSPLVERPQSVIVETELLHLPWLQELPEDLDVCIAQRDFEGAVDLVDKGPYMCLKILLHVVYSI